MFVFFFFFCSLLSLLMSCCSYPVWRGSFILRPYVVVLFCFFLSNCFKEAIVFLYWHFFFNYFYFLDWENCCSMPGMTKINNGLFESTEIQPPPFYTYESLYIFCHSVFITLSHFYFASTPEEYSLLPGL